MISFQRPGKDTSNSGNGTFDFLGFTHYWGQSRRGNWVIKRQTMRKRQARALRSLYVYCRNNKHEAIKEQYDKLRGRYNYYGIICN